MRKAIGLDRRRDPHRVLDVLHEIDADVVALQEADKRFGGRGSAVPHELIDSHGVYRPVHLGVRHKRVLDSARKHTDRLFKVNTRNIGWHGNAILVKRHIGILDCAAIELPTLEPRGGGHGRASGRRPAAPDHRHASRSQRAVAPTPDAHDPRDRRGSAAKDADGSDG
jgi:endonuclease/exonuclease/phosphatase family metal-dependent hydrolase